MFALTSWLICVTSPAGQPPLLEASVWSYSLQQPRGRVAAPSMPIAGRANHEQTNRRQGEAASLLLWLADCRGDVRHHGDWRQRPHRLLAVLSADPFRIRLGARRHRRGLLVRLCSVGRDEPADRAADG